MIRVVEFVGMMASGKTALAELVEKRLQRDGIRTYNSRLIDDWIQRAGEMQLEAPLDKATGALSSLIVGLKALRLGATVRPCSFATFSRARRLAGWHRQTRYLKQLPRKHIALQDEGAVHLIMPIVLCGRKYCPKQLDKLARSLAADEHKLFIFLRVDRDTALLRLRQRSGLAPGQASQIWRYARATPEQEHQIMLEMQMLFEQIGQSITAAAAHRTFLVTDGSDPESAADAVSRFIQTRMA